MRFNITSAIDVIKLHFIKIFHKVMTEIIHFLIFILWNVTLFKFIQQTHCLLQEMDAFLKKLSYIESDSLVFKQQGAKYEV